MPESEKPSPLAEIITQLSDRQPSVLGETAIRERLQTQDFLAAPMAIFLLREIQRAERARREAPIDLTGIHISNPWAGAFSSQALALGDSENATKAKSYFQAKRLRLATRKMRPKRKVIFKPSAYAWLFGKCDQSGA